MSINSLANRKAHEYPIRPLGVMHCEKWTVFRRWFSQRIPISSQANKWAHLYLQGSRHEDSCLDARAVCKFRSKVRAKATILETRLTAEVEPAVSFPSVPFSGAPHRGISLYLPSVFQLSNGIAKCSQNINTHLLWCLHHCLLWQLSQYMQSPML